MIENYRNRILSGDCIKQLKKLPDGSVDLIFADPPYFMQTEGELLRSNGTKFAGVEDQWDKFNDYAEYDKFCTAWLKECKRILKPDGAIWVIGAFQNIYRLGYIMQNLGYWILNDVVWSKPNAVPNFGGTRFQNSHETMLWCCKSKSAKYTFNYKTMKHLNGDKQDKSVWNVSICIGAERIKGADGKKAHSTQKPEQLLYKIILACTKPGEIVLDPFFGTGTTGAVAKRLGRDFIGIERETEYVKVAKTRLEAIQAAPTELERLALEVKPPKVPILELIETGYLTVGETLCNGKGEDICHLMADGRVTDGGDPLSIHKMSAKALGQTNHNGWDYFYVSRQNGLVPIDALRYQYTEELRQKE